MYLAKKKPLLPSRKSDYLHQTFLILRPNDFPWLIKPTRATTDFKCAISKEHGSTGDYYFRCHVNPVRLSPCGRERVLVESVAGEISQYLPKGFVCGRLPRYEKFIDKQAIKKAEMLKSKELEKMATKLLKGAA